MSNQTLERQLKGLLRFEQAENQKNQKIRKGAGLVGSGRPCEFPRAAVC